VNVLDENFPPNLRQLLRSWHVPVRHIGYDTGRKGMKDDEIIPFLLSLRRPTLFTLDLGFYRRNLCHTRYSLVCLNVEQPEAASFVRRLLRHSEFDAQAKRMGTVIRVSPTRISVWRLHAENEVFLNWTN